MRKHGREYDTVSPDTGSVQRTTAATPARSTAHGSTANRPVRERIVTAFFDQVDLADRAYHDLQTAGIDARSITVAANDTHARRDLAITEHTKAPEGGAAGAAVGASVGAIAGALALAGSIVLPGIGVIAGPIVGALAGAGALGAAGGLVGALVGAGIPEHEARVVQDAVREGGVVIAVHTDREFEPRVREILKSNQGRSLGAS